MDKVRGRRYDFLSGMDDDAAEAGGFSVLAAGLSFKE